MKVIQAANELAAGSRKVCLAIGVFDGVHLGHQQIIRQTVSDANQHEALAVVVTFDRHPSAVVAPDRVPPLIYSHPQKLRAIESLDADTLLEIPFDKAFSQLTGEQFIRSLAKDFGCIQSICVGAKILAIVDAFESVTLKHSHRGQSRSLLRAIAEINACDNQFAPEWIAHFNGVIRRMVES